MNRGIGYGWFSVSQWGMSPVDSYIEFRKVGTGLSAEICRNVLVKRIDEGNGNSYLRSEYVKRDEVTPEILELAGVV